MLTLSIDTIKVAAFIGFHEEEKERPNSFSIDVSIEMAMPEAVVTDSIDDTIDYAEVYAIILEQMNIPCHLLERKAYDIIHVLFERFVQADKVMLHIKKQTPLTMPDCDYAGIEMSLTREEVGLSI